MKHCSRNGERLAGTYHRIRIYSPRLESRALADGKHGKKAMAISAGEKSDSKTAENRAATRLTPCIGPTPTAPLLRESLVGIPQSAAPALFGPSNAGYFERVSLFESDCARNSQ